MAGDNLTFTGVDGDSWGVGWTFTQGTGDINSNRGRMVTGTGGFDGRSAYYDTGLANVDLTIDLEIPTNDAQFPEIRLRFDSGNYDYLRLLFEPHNDVVYFHSYDADVQQGLLDSASFAVAANDIIHVRALMVGTDVKVRLWRNAESEPTTWLLEATTSFGLTNDQIMVRTVTSNLGVAITNYWDNLGFNSVITGTIAVTDGTDTSSIAGEEIIEGTIAVTDDDDVSAIDGELVIVGTITITDDDDRSSIHANRFGRQPVEMREAGPVFPAGRRRRYYNPSRNPVTGPG
jgi:hypothetical protein